MGLVLLQKTIVATGVAEPLSASSVKCTQVIIQNDRESAAKCRIGDANVSATVGIELVKPTADQQLPSISIDGKGGDVLDLAEIYVCGTKDDLLDILYEVY